MKVRRGMRAVAIVCAVAVGALGLGVGAASAQQIDPDVRNVKRVKEPKNCPEIQGVTDTGIKLGSIAPMTGPLSGSGFFPNIIEGIQARFEVANANSELGKRKVTLVPVDDKGDAAQNLSAAQNLVEQEKVYAVLAESNAGAASAKYLADKGIPVVGWQLGLPIYGQYPNFFGFQNANAENLATDYSTRNAVVIDKVGGKKVALISGNTGNAAIFLEQINDAIKRHGKGMTVVYKTTDVPVGNTEWGSYAQQIKDSGADTVYAPFSTQDVISLSNALKQANAPVKNIILSAGYDPRVTGLAALEGALVGIEFKPLETTPAPKGIADFKAAMAQYKPQATVNQSSAVGWLTANTFIEGVKAAGLNCPTQKGFINNLRLVKDYTADGFFDPIDFQEVYNKPFRCAYYVKIDTTAKAFVPQFNGERVCGDLIKNNKLSSPATTAPATATPTTTVAR